MTNSELQSILNEERDELLRKHNILVVCGSGGVGKTTISSALALRAAQLGRRVAVCTIDPARRLADSLGLEMKEDLSVEVPGAGVCDGVDSEGALTAMMLDTKRTFDQLVKKYASSPEMAESILENRLYERISSQVSGTQEYMALEKLYELYHDERYELVVLDTPPTRHALDFLTAPERMARVLDHSSLQWILNPSSAGMFSFDILKRGFRSVIKKLDDLFGMQVFRDLLEFFRAFDGMYDGFRERSESVRKLLGSDEAAFVVATSPEANPLSEASFLISKLDEYEITLQALVVNRFHMSALDGGETHADLIQQAAASPYGAAGLFRSLEAYEALADADQERTMTALQNHQADFDVYWVPRFSHDVSDLEGLRKVSSQMLPGDRQGPRTEGL